jgi:hypothetical protein
MKEKFEELSDKYPNLSSLLVFGRLIRMTPKEGWNSRKINKWFAVLVDKDDYLKSEKTQILEWLKKPYKSTP